MVANLAVNVLNKEKWHNIFKLIHTTYCTCNCNTVKACIFLFQCAVTIHYIHFTNRPLQIWKTMCPDRCWCFMWNAGSGQLKCDGTRAETRICLSAKRRSPFKSVGGRQSSRLLSAEVCASAVVMLDTPCSEVVWRVLATHSICQFPLHFPSLRHRVPSHFSWSLLFHQATVQLHTKSRV